MVQIWGNLDWLTHRSAAGFEQALREDIHLEEQAAAAGEHQKLYSFWSFASQV